MAFVATAATVGGVVGLSGTAAIIGGGALIGAGVGGAYSAITGDGNILNSMLTGGLIGGAGAYGIGAMGGGGAGVQAQMAGPFWGGAAAPAVGPTATTVATPTVAAAATPAAEAAALLDAAAAVEGGTTAGMATEYATQEAAKVAASELAKKTAATGGMKALGYGLAGTSALQLLGGKKPGLSGDAGDPGNIRPYTYSPNQLAGNGEYPSPYASATYDAAGMPIMDTRERNYFNQSYAEQTPYSAKAGTVNPNITTAANGGLMAIGGPVQQMSQNMMGGQGNMFPQSQMVNTNFATPTQMPASAEVVRSDYDAKTHPYSGVMMANGGSVDGEAELRKTVMKNLQRLAPEQLQDVMGFMDEGQREQQFLMKNMPNYAEAMKPSISSMVEGAQYGDRMQQSLGQQPMGMNIQPRFEDERNYGGIASIGQQLDPNTRVNMMADLQRTPYDKNALDSVRRVGAGIDRKIGKDANLSAYYEQDPMGRDKSAGLRYTQQFNMGGDVGGAYDLGGYSDGGRLLKGPGDGVSDDIPATIAGKQPARLADGEFVIPARIVSELGNGSTDAGAKRLYAMMDRIQDGRKKTIGKKNVAKDTKAKKHLLA